MLAARMFTALVILIFLCACGPEESPRVPSEEALVTSAVDGTERPQQRIEPGNVRAVLAALGARCDLTAAKAPLRESAFRAVVRGAPALEPAVRKALVASDLSEDAKVIGVMAMQKLTDAAYIGLCEFLLRAHDQGNVSTRVLRAAIFPLCEWCTILEQSYRDPRVRSILLRYRKIDPLYSNVVDHVLSGAMWMATVKLKRSGAISEWK